MLEIMEIYILKQINLKGYLLQIPHSGILNGVSAHDRNSTIPNSAIYPPVPTRPSSLTPPTVPQTPP